MVNTDEISMKSFWEIIEQRLSAYSADELRDILRAMAKDTLPSQRKAFLAWLEPNLDKVIVETYESQLEGLLSDIEDLSGELSGKMQDPDALIEELYEWGRFDDEDEIGPYEDFIEPLIALFQRVASVFEQGEFSLVVTAYEALFEMLEAEDEYGYGVRIYNLSGINTNEHLARYLRAIYETTSLDQRPQILCNRMQHMPRSSFQKYLMFDDLVQITPRPVPDLEQFLVDWIAFLRVQNAPSGSKIDAWLREAVQLAEGTPGLAALARSEGKIRPRAYLDWFTALEKEGKYQEVLSEAHNALQILSPKLPIRAAIADHLCAAAIKLNVPDSLRMGRWEAFMVNPILPRLLDLWDMAADAEDQKTLMQQASGHLKDHMAQSSTSGQYVAPLGNDGLETSVSVGKSILAHSLLLSHNWEAALKLAAKGKVLGWSYLESYQGLVVAIFLILLSGQSPEVLPANLTCFWQWRLQYSVDAWTFGYEATSPISQRLASAYAELFAITTLSTQQQKKFLSWCIDVMHQRVDAIVGNQHRKSYNKAAVLTVACSEVLKLRGDHAAATALVCEVRDRFPR
ncbi:MAG: hypothetical protein JW981_03550, partial [Anaerolineae bacterium]|nr:hypothetical protein [Anaerolineae bacterium]